MYELMGINIYGIMLYIFFDNLYIWLFCIYSCWKKNLKKNLVDWKINIVYVLEMIYVLFFLLIMIIDLRCLMWNIGWYFKKFIKILI